MSEANFKSYLKNARISPRKLRLVADLIRGKRVQAALDDLVMTNKKGARILKKVIDSAVAGARDSGRADIDRLYISEVIIDHGMTLKRFLPRAQGRATPIRKRMAHVQLALKEKK